MVSSRLILSLLAVLLVPAATASPSACTRGICSYQSGDGTNSAYSVLTLNTESHTSLSDITDAAGWDIIECDTGSTGVQDIRLVCTDTSKGCDHLFEGGEEHTIVRLPEHCGGGPFARVVKSWVPEDQSVPTRLAKRQLERPVRMATIDFDFAQIPESKGKVYIAASATNSKVQRDALTQSATKRSLEPLRHATRKARASAAVREFVNAGKKKNKRAPERRGFFDWVDDAVDGVSNIVDDVRDAVTDVVGDIKDAVTGTAYKAGDKIGEIVDDATGEVIDYVTSLDDKTSFDEVTSKGLSVLDINQSFPIFTYTSGCPSKGTAPGFEASIAVSAAVAAKIDADVGFMITGSIVPPKIDDLAFTTSLNGNVAAVFDLKATLNGAFTTGLVPLLKTGLPGLTFPGILTVGPIISLNALAKASLGITADFNLTTTFDLPQVDLVFPPSAGQSAATVIPRETPVNVNVGVSETLKGRAEVHIIPRLELGVEILGGAQKTTVFLNIDGSSGADFTLSAAQTGSVVTGTGDSPTVSVDELENAFGGTIGADVGVAIVAGATASLPPFFDQAVSLSLFSRTFPLFKKTFGTPASKRSLLIERAEDEKTPNTSGVTCPSFGNLNIAQPILAVPATTPQQQ